MKLNKSKHCLNCHEEINDSNYCPKCGQLNSDKKLTLRQIVKEFIGDYFTFDSKFFKSIVPLLIKPGHLTREYLKGRRATYIFPLRLYIFTTFLFFFVITINTKLDFDKYTNPILDSTKVEEAATKDTLVSLNDNFEEKLKQDLSQNISYIIDSTQNRKEVKLKGPGFGVSFDEGADTSSTFVRYMQNKGKYLASLGSEGGSLFWKEVINQLPKVMFLLLPFFALILKILYARRKILYVEHLVFSLHVHTFMFVILIIAAFISNMYIILGLVFFIFIYILLSQYNFYEQSKTKTFFKFLFLMWLYLIFLIPSFGILAFLAFVSI